jgi:hypothetical protein
VACFATLGSLGRRTVASRLALDGTAALVFCDTLGSLGVRSGVVNWDTDGAEGQETPTAVLPRQAAPRLAEWPALAAQAMDRVTLASAGIELPEGANVLAARIYGGGASPAYQFYEAGGGAFTESFYPASSVKLLAALGAIDYVATWGFTGGAAVNGGATLREIYDAAIRWSSNDDYDELVRIAGADRLNLEFLPAHGFGSTVIQESYGWWGDVALSPAMVLTEGDRQVELPERAAQGLYGCEGLNCSSLFDLSDAVRRIVLDAELPAEERFAIAPADVVALQEALLGAEGWIAPGVQELLGPDTQVFGKPGHVGGLDCVDDAVVSAPSGHRYIVAVSVPDAEGCEFLARLAHDVLEVLDAHDEGPGLRTDGSVVPIVNGHQIAG